MDVTWQRDPASVDGPAVIETEVGGSHLRVAERGNHWFATVTHPDGSTWSQTCRTEEEAKILSLREARAWHPSP